MLRREGARRREETSALAVGAIQTSGHRHAQTGPTGIVTPDRDGVVGHEGRVLVMRKCAWHGLHAGREGCLGARGWGPCELEKLRL